MSKNILTEPSKHKLPDLLRELKWGRPAADQRFLLWLADKIESAGIGNIPLNELADELDREMNDSANWWKKENPSE